MRELISWQLQAVFDAASVLAGKNMTNPSSLRLSAEMLLRHLGWTEATDLVVAGVSGAISRSLVSCDSVEIGGAEALSCSKYMLQL